MTTVALSLGAIANSNLSSTDSGDCKERFTHIPKNKMPSVTYVMQVWRKEKIEDVFTLGNRHASVLPRPRCTCSQNRL